MKKNPKYSFKHLSMRVPWHDNKWNGTVCKDPKSNIACLILKNCAQNRKDDIESKNAGKSIDDLLETEFPVCVGERGTFLAPFSYTRHIKHPYSESSPDTHGHLNETRLFHPAFAAPAIPFAWMIKKDVEERAKLYDLDYDPSREPKLNFTENWVQEYHNQKALLDCFFEHLEENKSLIFFYAKQVPFVEESGRVLIGVGRINKIDASEKYNGSNKKFSCAYWEHMVHHSIRPNFNDGFLLPYHDALIYANDHPDFDPAEVAVVAPADKKYEFSYASEHISNDTAIRVLLDCIRVLEIAEDKNIGKNHKQSIQWIHDRVHEIEKLRGDYPGMGAVLCALGIEKGHFVAAEINNNMKGGEDPWRLFERALNDPSGILSDATAALIPLMVKKTYQRISDRENRTRIDLLHLLSRFDINQDQAKRIFVKEERKAAGIDVTDEDILDNPYLLFEKTIHTVEPIHISTIDLGLFLSGNKEVLPKSLSFNDPLDERRIRALTVEQLEIAAWQGHTLLPRKDIIQKIRSLPITPKCEVNSDHYEIAEEIFTGVIENQCLKDGSPAYQLARLQGVGNIIREKVIKRYEAETISFEMNWRTLIDMELKKHTEGTPDELELRAREEKAAALKTLAESRISVLIGPAGTGKTILLSIFASQDDIKKGGILFLAPTGKARVRMEERAKQLEIPALTIAQFLFKYDRFDGETQEYKLSDKKCEANYDTVIIDEASMLTEEMLATLFDSFKKVKRFILVGDHRQLPPIGPGRPFFDIINYLKPENIESVFPRVAKGYAELTIRRRQGGSNRHDLQLAEWFSGSSMEPGADLVLNEILNQRESPYLRLIRWQDEEDFSKQFEQALVEELKLENIKDVSRFNISMGSSDGRYFNWREAVSKIEEWQILSPIREKVFGVKAINRKIHQLFREAKIEYAYRSYKLPKPMGNEEIVYGDKVINLSNQRRHKDYVYPQDGLNYIANGEIGIVVGQWKQKWHTFPGRPQNMEVEFSSQQGYKYTFRKKEFGEESDPPLELAYAITVHKAQGSEFGKVFLIVPNPCFLLTREMLYTALTRQRERVIVLYQGDKFQIKELSSPLHSDTLSRITNLFQAPDIKEVDGKYLEKNLIHQASDGTFLRSKSELLIYQRLLDKELEPLYERELEIKEVVVLPDFTIEDDDTGKLYYWEHCGMMHDPEYVARWESKKKWYLDNDIKPYEQGGGKNGALIVTQDKPTEVDGETRGAISVKEIDELIAKVFDI